MRLTKPTWSSVFNEVKNKNTKNDLFVCNGGYQSSHSSVFNEVENKLMHFVQ